MPREDMWSSSEAMAGEHERNQHDPREKNDGYEADETWFERHLAAAERAQR